MLKLVMRIPLRATSGGEGTRIGMVAIRETYRLSNDNPHIDPLRTLSKLKHRIDTAF